MSEFDPHIIKFIQKSDIIKTISDGHSGALLYKVIRNKQIFFLKIFNNSQNMQILKKNLEICKKLKIKTLDIIDYGNIDSFNKYYIVYNFINGINLKKYTDTEDFDLKDIQMLGKYVGKELLKLKNYKDFDKNLFSHYSISSLVEETIHNFSLLSNNSEADQIIKDYFTDKELKELKNRLYVYSKVFDNIEPRLIHGDIKRSNIMIDENKKIYLVDIESMQLNYDIINVKYQITWCLFEDNIREQKFIKGFFDGIYGDKRPSDFNKQIIFITIINFFTEAYHLGKRAEIDKLLIYVKKSRSLFNKIIPMCLEQKSII